MFYNWLCSVYDSTVCSIISCCLMVHFLCWLWWQTIPNAVVMVSSEYFIFFSEKEIEKGKCMRVCMGERERERERVKEREEEDVEDKRTFRMHVLWRLSIWQKPLTQLWWFYMKIVYSSRERDKRECICECNYMAYMTELLRMARFVSRYQQREGEKALMKVLETLTVLVCNIQSTYNIFD